MVLLSGLSFCNWACAIKAQVRFTFLCVCWPVGGGGNENNITSEIEIVPIDYVYAALERTSLLARITFQLFIILLEFYDVSYSFNPSVT